MKIRATPKPPAAELLKLDNQLCFALYSASRAMTAAYRPLLDAVGLTYPQYLALLVLWQHGSVTVGRLGELLRLDSGTLSPLLKRLEAMGHIARARSATDERAVLVSLTPAGRALKAQAQAFPLEIGCSTGLEIDALGELRDTLKHLVARLDAARAGEGST
jgi:DNA-binding MarR family transcriptional regulator